VAGWASHAEKLQPFPDVTRPESAHGVESVALEIGLMSMHAKDPLPGASVLQDQPLVRHHPFLLHPIVTVALDLVVAHDELQPLLSVKLVQQIKDLPVCAPDGAELPVLPQFIAISDFDVREPLLAIVG
jgi:hypothetical protein